MARGWQIVGISPTASFRPSRKSVLRKAPSARLSYCCIDELTHESYSSTMDAFLCTMVFLSWAYPRKAMNMRFRWLLLSLCARLLTDGDLGGVVSIVGLPP